MRGSPPSAEKVAALISECPLVSVIVPAYNAETTIDRTLSSLRAQTYAHLEIIVVDDGSRDGTARIVQRHASRDPRVRLISQRNAGVAAARNCGIREARGTILAPFDADDLCTADRIVRLVDALEAAGPECGVAYSWSAVIDGEDRIHDISFQPTSDGDVTDALCRSNFVANGSAAIMRNAAVSMAGGYDERLRSHGAQGCEDWALLLQLSQRWRFAIVPEFLVGYRAQASNMSGNGLQMMRSFELVAAAFLAERPDMRQSLALGRKNLLAWLMGNAGRDRRHRLLSRLGMQLALTSPRWAFRIVSDHYLTRRSKRPAFERASPAREIKPGSLFPVGSPADLPSQTPPIVQLVAATGDRPAGV